MKSVIRTSRAPQAIGPYSQAVAAANLVILSGQIGLDPASGNLVPGGVEAETRRVLDNLSAVLAEAGLGPNAVLKTTIYLVDLADFGAVNQIYAEYFSEPFPARATVGVATLPRGARVEIEAIAVRE